MKIDTKLALADLSERYGIEMPTTGDLKVVVRGGDFRFLWTRDREGRIVAPEADVVSEEIADGVWSIQPYLGQDEEDFVAEIGNALASARARVTYLVRPMEKLARELSEGDVISRPDLAAPRVASIENEGNGTTIKLEDGDVLELASDTSLEVVTFLVRTIGEVRPGDMLDMVADPIADPDGNLPQFEFEYAIVEAITYEPDDCVLVTFENASFAFHKDHPVRWCGRHPEYTQEPKPAVTTPSVD